MNNINVHLINQHLQISNSRMLFSITNANHSSIMVLDEEHKINTGSDVN